MAKKKINWFQADKRSRFPQEATGGFSVNQNGENGAAGSGASGSVNYNTYNTYNMSPTGYGAQQSTPMVQPLVLVPYSSPTQPLYHYPDGTLPAGDIDSAKMQGQVPYSPLPPVNGANGMPTAMNGMDMAMDFDYEEPKKEKKKTNVKNVFVAIFALLFVAVMGIGYFVDKIAFIAPYVTLTDLNGFQMVYGFVNSLIDGTFAFSLDDVAGCVAILMSAASVLALLTFVFALIGVKHKRTPLFVKILDVLLFVAVAAALVWMIVSKGIGAISIGFYIAAGLALLVFLLAIIDKKRK